MRAGSGAVAPALSVLLAVLVPSSADACPAGPAGTGVSYRTTVVASGEVTGQDLNDRGVVVGSVGGPYATIWAAGRARVVETPGTTLSVATAVNGRGLVAGVVMPGGRGPWRAVVWSGGHRRYLGVSGWPTAVNDHGVVVGVAGTGSRSYAFRWANGRLTTLTRVGIRPGANLRVSDVNEAGEIVGSDARGPFRWTGRRLERPPAGSGVVDAPAVTGRGDVAATRVVDGVGWEAVLWTRSGAVRTVGTIGVRTPDGRRLGGAVRDVNDRGQIVGETVREWPDGVHDSAPFRLDHGVLTLLPTPTRTGSATRINAGGTVLGRTTDEIVTWTPTQG